MTKPHRRAEKGIASETLTALVTQAQQQNGLPIATALNLMGKSGFGFVMLLLALPALIAIPGPFGMVFGSALAIVSAQFAIGLRSRWLPSVLSNRHVSAKFFEALQRHASPLLSKLERRVQPGRMKALAGRRMPHVLALPIFCLAVAIALPIPFGNLAPVSALCVIAIGLVERDGFIVLMGLVATLIALTITGLLVYLAAGVIPWI